MYGPSRIDGERNRNVSERTIGSIGAGTTARRSGAVGAVLVALLAIWSPAVVSAATPNVCHITGVNRSVAKKVFPKLSGVSASQTQAQTSPPNLGVCDITPRTNVASLEVELWSASVFQQQIVTFTNNGKTQRLHGLGHGAFYSPVKGDKNDASLLFKRGAYTILIDPTRIGGTSADYPTENQYLKLARAIYKHLR
jgi:hypothetical protein